MKEPDIMRGESQVDNSIHGYRFTPVAAGAGANDLPVGNHPQLFASSSGPGQSVTVKRRRQSATGSQTVGRAEASTRPGGGGSGGGFSGGGSPRRSGGSGGLGGFGTLIFLIIIVLIWFFSDGSDSSPSSDVTDTPTGEQTDLVQQDNEDWGGLIPAAHDQGSSPTAPSIQVRPTQQAPASSTASPSPEGDRWTIMLYQNADDQVLEQDIYIDLNEAERVGSTANVTVVAQFDRYRGGFKGDGNWTSTKRFLVEKDEDLQRVGSREIEDIGEANLADGQTLVDFIKWAVENYPADKYALILSDHGMGWPGGWSDPTGDGTARNLPLAQAIDHDMLWLMEMDQALEQARRETGIDQFELIGLDACLMAHLEVFTALAPHARYAVASQETEPAVGWAYTSLLSELNQNPAMNGAELGAAIVRSYIVGDQRILDDEARAGFARGTAQQVANQLGQGITLTAADLSHIPALNTSFNNFAYALQGVNQKAVAKARRYAQSYTSIFGSDVQPSYLDIVHFMGMAVRESRSSELEAAADSVIKELEKTVIAEKHGPGRPGSFGISIYFPNSELYGSAAAGPRSYSVAAERFVNESTWDEFLAFHYTGQRFRADERVTTVPANGIATRSPATGGITVSPITASSSEVDPDGSIQMSAEISGENIGYIKLLIGMYDPASDSIHLLDTDYLESPDTQELHGVYYPVWPEGTFTMNFEFEPIVTAITDGTTQDVALLEPLSYGRTADEATYTVNGIYTFADGTRRAAQLHLRDGYLRNVYAFSEEELPAMPREVIPSQGDTFTIVEKWLDGNQNPVQEQGATLTFGAGDIQWQNLIAAAGDYVIGFIVEDLDGKQYSTYTQIRVNE